MLKFARGVLIAGAAFALATAAPSVAAAEPASSGSASGSSSLPCMIQQIIQYGTISAGESAYWNIPACRPF